MVDLSKVSLEVEVQGNVTTLAEGDVGAAPEVPRLEEADVAAYLRSKGDEGAMKASNKISYFPGMRRLPR